MQHTWHCERCCATWHTYCGGGFRDEGADRMMVVMLCAPCLRLYQNDPVFQLLFKLDKKLGYVKATNWRPDPLIDELKKICLSRMDRRRTEEEYATCVKKNGDIFLKAIVMMKETHKDCKHTIMEPCPDNKKTGTVSL